LNLLDFLLAVHNEIEGEEVATDQLITMQLNSDNGIVVGLKSLLSLLKISFLLGVSKLFISKWQF